MSAALTPPGRRFIVENGIRQPFRLKLFVDAGQGFKELEGFGYADQPLSIIGIDSGALEVRVAFEPVEFIFSGPAGRIYGSYAYHEASKTVIWTDRLVEAFKAVNNGDSLTVEPVFIMREFNG